MIWIEWGDSTGDDGSARWGDATDEQIDEILRYATQVMGREPYTTT